MTVYKKLTEPNPDDPVEVTIAKGWNALAKVNAPAEFGKAELMATRQPMADVCLELQYLHGKNKDLREYLFAKRDELVGHTENSPEEFEFKAICGVIEKITGRPA